MSKVKCGPRFSDGHNLSLKNFTVEELVQGLVKLASESCRVILGLGFGHHQIPTVDDEEIEEVFSTAWVTAVTSNAEFVLGGVPPDRVLEWPTWEEITDADVDNQGMLRQPIIQADRGGCLSSRTSKAKGGGKPKIPKRPQPWYDASCPPVFSSDLLALPDNLMGSIDFSKVPYMRNEINPPKWRWRPYSHLTGVPFFGRRALGCEWRYRTRYLR